MSTSARAQMERIDSVAVLLCKEVKALGATDDTATILKLLDTHVYRLSGQTRTSDVWDSLYFRVARSCSAFDNIVRKFVPQNGDWEVLANAPPAVAAETVKGVRDHLRFMYKETNGDTVIVELDNGLWYETFKDGSYSLLNMRWQNHSEFELSFISSNNRFRRYMSKKGDRYQYRIIGKGKDHYRFAVLTPGRETVASKFYFDYKTPDRFSGDSTILKAVAAESAPKLCDFVKTNPEFSFYKMDDLLQTFVAILDSQTTRLSSGVFQLYGDSSGAHAETFGVVLMLNTFDDMVWNCESFYNAMHNARLSFYNSVKKANQDSLRTVIRSMKPSSDNDEKYYEQLSQLQLFAGDYDGAVRSAEQYGDLIGNTIYATYINGLVSELTGDVRAALIYYRYVLEHPAYVALSPMFSYLTRRYSIQKGSNLQ